MSDHLENFESQVYFVLSQIPHGKIISYGEVATMAGFKGYARHVGRLLSNLPKDSQLPWHRVLNSQGQISRQGEHLQRQREKLLSEGIKVSESGRISRRIYLWRP